MKEHTFPVVSIETDLLSTREEKILVWDKIIPALLYTQSMDSKMKTDFDRLLATLRCKELPHALEDPKSGQFVIHLNDYGDMQMVWRPKGRRTAKQLRTIIMAPGDEHMSPGDYELLEVLRGVPDDRVFNMDTDEFRTYTTP